MRHLQSPFVNDGFALVLKSFHEHFPGHRVRAFWTEDIKAPDGTLRNYCVIEQLDGSWSIGLDSVRLNMQAALLSFMEALVSIAGEDGGDWQAIAEQLLAGYFEREAAAFEQFKAELGSMSTPDREQRLVPLFRDIVTLDS